MKNKIINLSPAITNISSDILKIEGLQPEYYRTKKAINVLKENKQMILDLIDCKGGEVAFLTSSGTGGMEASVLNFIKPDERVLVINGGTFGQRWLDLCCIHGLNMFEYKVDFGKNINFYFLEQVIHSIKPNVILIQACETSSGQKFDLEKVGKICKQKNIRLIVDAVSSFLADEYLMDKWNIDVSILSSQKALSLKPGIAMVVYKKIINKPKSYYFDLSKYEDYGEDIGLPFTPNLMVFYQLNLQLKKILLMGKQQYRHRISLLANDFRKRIKDLPLEIIAETPSNCATGLYTERTDVKEFFNYLITKNIYFVPSGGLKGKKFIVGHIGDLPFNCNILFVRELEKWLKK